MGTNAETLPASLTERRFRHFWEQTASLHRLARRLDLDLRRRAAPVFRDDGHDDRRDHALQTIVSQFEISLSRARSRWPNY